MMRGLDNRVRVERDRIDSFFNQKLGKLRIIGWSLAANSYFLAVANGSINRHRDHFLNGPIPLVKKMRDHLGVAVEPQRKLRKIVRPDRVAIKNLKEFVGKDDIRRQFAHGIDLEVVLTLYEAVFGH